MAEAITTASTFVRNINRVNLLKRALFNLNLHRNTAFTSLKPKQVDTLYSLAENHDTVSVLPTGYGKSLIFNLLPYYFSVITSKSSKILIISPLNAIIEEQTKSSDDIINVNDSFLSDLVCEEGCCSRFDGNIFIGHPEHILSKKFMKYIRLADLESDVTHVVIDEAHCICLWGCEFRPKFREIALLRSIIPTVKMVALTATATDETIKDICDVLKLKNTKVITASVDRPNIYLEVYRRLPSTGIEEQMSEKSVERCAYPILEEILENKHMDTRTIIYTSLKGIGIIMELAIRMNDGVVPPEVAQYHAPQTSEVTIKPYVAELKEKKENFPKTVIYCNLKWCGTGYEECQRNLSEHDLELLVAQYHAPCTNEMKDFVVDSMAVDGTTRLLFATEAYSMGTDTPNIRRIVHFGVPKSMESYMQEVGRAGRDSNYAEAIMYFNNNDIAKNVHGLDKEMADYCRHENCRWNFLCSHFGCIQEGDRNVHTCCDNCTLKCSCQDCDSENIIETQTDEDEDDRMSHNKDRINQMLLQYFDAENSVIQMPNPSLYTGLSRKLAFDISNTKLDDVEIKFNFIEKKYLNNIISIMEYFESQEIGDI